LSIFGATTANRALMAAWTHARGNVIVPMDGDLQNDPADIGRLLAKLEEGFDVVSGWRKDRQDHAVRRNLLSRIANRVISRVSGVHLHDYGCSLKAYRREILDGVKLYGEMPPLRTHHAAWNGARVCEIEVQHHPRLHGESKYGLERIVKVLLDLLVVTFLFRYAEKPVYVFGGFGLFSVACSFSRRCRGGRVETVPWCVSDPDAAAVARCIPRPASARRQHPDGAARRNAQPHLPRIAGQAVYQIGRIVRSSPRGRD
jgi:hypothetical protein